MHGSSVIQGIGDQNADGIVFREVQRVRMWWVWAMVGVLATAAWGFWFEQVVLGGPLQGLNRAPDAVMWAIALVVGVLAPLLVGMLKMTTDVVAPGLGLDGRERAGQVVVTWFPFWRTRVRLDELRGANDVEYRPVRDYGGWGIKWTPHAGWVYNVQGHHGVRLLFTESKRRLLIGSARSAELARVINEQVGVGD